MAIKYKREGGVRIARETRYTPYKSLFSRMMPDPKRRLLMIYSACAFFGILALMAGRIQQISEVALFHEQPLTKGMGQIVDKATQAPGEAETGHWIHIAAPLLEGGALQDWMQVDETVWNTLEVGDWVGILFQLSKNGKRIRIQECGLVALPPPIPVHSAQSGERTPVEGAKGESGVVESE